MHAPIRGSYYYYGHPSPWYAYGHTAGGPKIVELEPSEIGGARSQLDTHSDLASHRRYESQPQHVYAANKQAEVGGSTNKRYSTASELATERVVTRRLGTRNNGLDEVAMNGKSGTLKTKPRSWKEVNDDISARMIAASSDSPPIIPRRDYDNSPAPSLPRGNRSVCSADFGVKRYSTDENARLMNGPDSDWSAHDDFRRPSPYMDNGQVAPPHSQQLVLYTGPPPQPPMAFSGQNEPPLFPPSPFGPPLLAPPPPHPDLYGYGGMAPFGPPPMFMEPPPHMKQEGEAIYGPPSHLPLVPPPPLPPPPGYLPGPMLPMDFEMFTWNQQKMKKERKKAMKRSRSMEFLMPPPPPPWMLPPPPPPPFLPPPPFIEDHAIYGAFPPRPPLPLALPPPPPPMTSFPAPYSNSLAKKEPLNGNKSSTVANGAKCREAQKDGRKGSNEEYKHSTCYLMCCKGFTQILWIIIGIILVGLVLGLVLGLTLV